MSAIVKVTTLCTSELTSASLPFKGRASHNACSPTHQALPVNVFLQREQNSVRRNNQLKWLKAAESQGFTPLLLACARGHAGVAQELLEVGAGVHMAGKVSRMFIALIRLYAAFFTLKFPVSGSMHTAAFFRPRALCVIYNATVSLIWYRKSYLTRGTQMLQSHENLVSTS